MSPGCVVVCNGLPSSWILTLFEKFHAFRVIFLGVWIESHWCIFVCTRLCSFGIRIVDAKLLALGFGVVRNGFLASWRNLIATKLFPIGFSNVRLRHKSIWLCVLFVGVGVHSPWVINVGTKLCPIRICVVDLRLFAPWVVYVAAILFTSWLLILGVWRGPFGVIAVGVGLCAIGIFFVSEELRSFGLKFSGSGFHSLRVDRFA